MTTTQRPRTPRRSSPAPGPNPANRGLLLVGIAVAIGLILLVKSGGIGFDSDDENVDIGQGASGSEQTTTTATPTTAPVVTVAPATVKTFVANASNGADDKLGSKTANFLKASGYTQISVAAKNATQPATQTVVYFGQGFENNAKAIATSLGLPPTQAQPLAADAKFAADQPADAGLVVIAAVDIKPQVDAGAAAGQTATTAAGGQTTTTVAGQTTTTANG